MESLKLTDTAQEHKGDHHEQRMVVEGALQEVGVLPGHAAQLAVQKGPQHNHHQQGQENVQRREPDQVLVRVGRGGRIVMVDVVAVTGSPTGAGTTSHPHIHPLGHVVPVVRGESGACHPSVSPYPREKSHLRMGEKNAKEEPTNGGKNAKEEPANGGKKRRGKIGQLRLVILLRYVVFGVTLNVCRSVSHVFLVHYASLWCDICSVRHSRCSGALWAFCVQAKWPLLLFFDVFFRTLEWKVFMR